MHRSSGPRKPSMLKRATPCLRLTLLTSIAPPMTEGGFRKAAPLPRKSPSCDPLRLSYGCQRPRGCMARTARATCAAAIKDPPDEIGRIPPFRNTPRHNRSPTGPGVRLNKVSRTAARTQASPSHKKRGRSRSIGPRPPDAHNPKAPLVYHGFLGCQASPHLHTRRRVSHSTPRPIASLHVGLRPPQCAALPLEPSLTRRRVTPSRQHGTPRRRNRPARAHPGAESGQSPAVPIRLRPTAQSRKRVHVSHLCATQDPVVPQGGKGEMHTRSQASPVWVSEHPPERYGSCPASRRHGPS